MIFGKRTERHQTRKAEGRQKADESENADYGRPKAAGDQEARAELRAIESGEKTRSVWNCVYGNVARVVYSRTFYSLTTPLTGRLNKSPHTVHAIANRHKQKWHGHRAASDYRGVRIVQCRHKRLKAGDFSARALLFL